MGRLDLQFWTRIGAMNWPLYWERRHPCRRVSGLTPRHAGKDAGAPSPGSWRAPTCNSFDLQCLPVAQQGGAFHHDRFAGVQSR